MKELHLQRLTKLANHMARQRKRLLMHSFFQPCGTPACVLGHATNIKEFYEAGLRPEVAIDGGPADVRYRGRDGEGAGKAFFGLSWDDAFGFFGWDGAAYGTDTPTPKKVAKTIREFVKEKRELHK